MAVLDQPAVTLSARVSAPSRRVPHAEGGAAVITLIVSLAVALIVDHPLLPELETGYILNAQWMAGVDQIHQPTLPGYSVLLAPIMALTEHLDAVLWSAHVVNALLAGVSAALTVRLMRVIAPSAAPGILIVAAVVINVYAPFRVAGTVAVAENLLLPASLMVALAFARVSRAPSAGSVIALSLLAGATAVVHPVGVAISVATAVALAARLRGHGRMTVLAAAPLVVALAGLLAVAAFTDAAVGTVILGDEPYRSWWSLVSDNLNPRAAARTFLALLGTAFYLSVATCGVATLGGIEIVRRIRSRDSGARDLAMWTAAAMAATLLLSGLVTNRSAGAGALYGWIVEPVLVPLLAFGTAALLGGTTVPVRRLVVLFPAAAGAFLLVARGPRAFEEPLPRHFATVGVEPLRDLADRIHVPTIAFAGLVGASVVLFAARRWPVKTLVALGVAFTATAVSSVASIADDVVDVGNSRSIVDAVRQHLLVDGSGRPCIALDAQGVDDAAFQRGYRLALLDARLEDWDSMGDEPPCSAAVISARADLSASWPGATLLEAENRARDLLWVLPGELQESLPQERRGLEQPAASLPAGPIATIEVVDIGPAAASPDDLITVRMRLTNMSDRPFVPSGSLRDWTGGVAVGLEWRRADTNEPLAEPQRVHLPRVVWPGDVVEIESAIRPVLFGRPLDAGDWLLRAELVQEGVRWFGDDVSAATVVEITGHSDGDEPVEAT
jgi:hypothetical protein